MKFNVATITVITAAVFTLSACKDEMKSETWYKSHADETFKVYKKCLETGEGSQNCENARHAARLFSVSGDQSQQDKFTDLINGK